MIVLDRPPERAPYKPYGAALRAWKSGHREVLLSGPANTGKSRCWLEKLHYCADKYAGMRGLIVRKTRQSLTHSAMVTYEKKVLPRGWMDRLIKFRTAEQQYEYPNGSIIAVSGLDDPQKVMSSEWDMIFFQEATEGTEEDWEALTIRMRNKVMPYQQLGGDCNPSYPTHWLKRRCDYGKTLMLESRHEDNPSVTKEDLATLDALTGTRYLRYRKGIWAAVEGMVYDMWDSAIHKVSRQQLIDLGVFYHDGSLNRQVIRHTVAGVDWGFTNPGVITVFGIDNDGRMYLLREIYRTQRTDDWWLEQAVQLDSSFHIEAFICDPSMPGYIRKFQSKGLNALPANNDISLGVQSLQRYLRVASDGRPRFMVYEYSLPERDEERAANHQPFCFEDEILEYSWPKPKDGQPFKEVPVKLQDHSLDSVRYTCMYLDSDPMVSEMQEDIAQAWVEYRGY